jgi:phage terminase large subunit-like protein
VQKVSKKPYKWSDEARPEQLWPWGSWRYWLIIAGRGFGKTRAASENICDWIAKRVNKDEKNIAEHQDYRIGVFSRTLGDIHRVMISGPSGILQGLRRRKIKFKYLRHNHEIRLNGLNIFIFSGLKIQGVRGMEFDLVWIDEMAKIPNNIELFDQINLCLRRKNSRMIISTTPKKNKLFELLKKNPDCIVTTGSTYENPHLPAEFFQMLNEQLDQEYVEEEVFGRAKNKYFWSRDDFIYKKFNSHRVISYHIGLDIAVGPGLTGITLSSSATDGFFVLDCLSTRGDHWLDTIKQLTRKFQPITIDYETNQGGNLLPQLFNKMKLKAKQRPVRVSSGKKQRHKLLHLMYKLGGIFHGKPLVQLEKAMLSGKLVDSIDALFCTLYFRDLR